MNGWSTNGELNSGNYRILQPDIGTELGVKVWFRLVWFFSMCGTQNSCKRQETQAELTA